MSTDIGTITIDTLFQSVINNKYTRDCIFQRVSLIHRYLKLKVIKWSDLNTTPLTTLLRYSNNEGLVFKSLYQSVASLLPQSYKETLLHNAYKLNLLNIIYFIEDDINRNKDTQNNNNNNQPRHKDQANCKLEVAWRLGDIDQIKRIYEKDHYDCITYHIFHFNKEILKDSIKRDQMVELTTMMLSKSKERLTEGSIYHLLNVIGQYGYIDLLKVLLQHKNTPEDLKQIQFSFQPICEFGRIEIIKYLLENYNGLLVTEFIVEDAIKGGSIELVQLLCNHMKKYNQASIKNFSPRTFTIAARDGNLDMLKYLVDDICQMVPIDNELLGIAMKQGHQDIVNYLLDNTNEWREKKRMTSDYKLQEYTEKWVVSKIHKSLLTLDYVKELLDQPHLYQVDLSIVSQVIQHNNMEIFKYIFRPDIVTKFQQQRTIMYILQEISRYGNLEMLHELSKSHPHVVLSEHILPQLNRLLSLSSLNNHFEFVKYLMSEYPSNESIGIERRIIDTNPEMYEFLFKRYPAGIDFTELFQRGKMDFIEYAYQHAPEKLNSSITHCLITALKHNQINAIKWIEERYQLKDQFAHYYWDNPEYLGNLIECNYLELVTHMVSSKSILYKNLSMTNTYAIKSGSIEMVKLLHKHIEYTSKDLKLATKFGITDIVSYLLNAGVKCKDTLLKKAAKHGQLDCLKVIIDHIGIQCTTLESLLTMSLGCGHHHVSLYLLELINQRKSGEVNIDTKGFTYIDHSVFSIKFITK